jgi:DNA-binding NarL/FixJ family response regulator
MATKILLVEDFTLIRSGVRALLEQSGKGEVVGEAVNGRDAVKLARQLKPDIVLMDVAMPELTGIEATRQICEHLPDVRVIMLSMHSDRQYIFESLRAGASGYVYKNAALEELLAAIDKVLTGGTYISTELADMVRDEYFRWARGERIGTELEKLTAREREVLQLIAEGNSSAEIARRLFISVRTVDTHRFHIMEKLDIHSIAGLTKFAIRNGLGSL